MVILLLICGCIPKLGALVNIIPLPVLGGAMIAMFGMVMAYGVSILGNINFQNQNIYNYCNFSRVRCWY